MSEIHALQFETSWFLIEKDLDSTRKSIRILAVLDREKAQTLRTELGQMLDKPES